MVDKTEETIRAAGASSGEVRVVRSYEGPWAAEELLLRLLQAHRQGR